MDTPDHVLVILLGLFSHFTNAESADVVATARADQDVVVVSEAHGAAVSVVVSWVECVLAHDCLFRNFRTHTHFFLRCWVVMAIDRCKLLGCWLSLVPFWMDD